MHAAGSAAAAAAGSAAAKGAPAPARGRRRRRAGCAAAAAAGGATRAAAVAAAVAAAATATATAAAATMPAMTAAMATATMPPSRSGSRLRTPRSGMTPRPPHTPLLPLPCPQWRRHRLLRRRLLLLLPLLPLFLLRAITTATRRAALWRVPSSCLLLQDGWRKGRSAHTRRRRCACGAPARTSSATARRWHTCWWPRRSERTCVSSAPRPVNAAPPESKFLNLAQQTAHIAARPPQRTPRVATPSGQARARR